MINRLALLSDLQRLLKTLEADLLERSESAELPDVGRRLHGEYERAQAAGRTAQNYEDWRNDEITQVSAAWVLSCVFVRFLEDNRLIEPPRIAGPAERLQQARDEHELYFREHPTETDREYLLAVFDELARLPGTKEVFGDHNPIRELPNWLSGDAAGVILNFFQKIDANTGQLVHDFTDPEWDTRFLGDLYQDLSEAARKKYALLQTPEFVEEFILDRTLEPALEEFGLDALPISNQHGNQVFPAGFRMIDPACGSGHFLLGSFRRLLDRRQKQEPGAKIRDVVQKVLDSIHGVDVNPYAVAIARFRLLLVAMKACGIQRLADAPGFHFNLACGDSLLHAPLRSSPTETQGVFDFELTADDSECEHAYQSEDLPTLKAMLRAGQYHAVVANPPYITPKDRQLNERYRKRFESCHMKYSLAVPFLERIFRLAVPGGFTGQITANSFMKREFGKKLIEWFLPKIDLTHVIDTSGAYIPGHGTPTVILFGRHRLPVGETIRAVMGIRGEPSTPDDPARGLVWSAIVRQVDQPGSQSEFVSVTESERGRFHGHPWSIGGGGAAELKELLDDRCGNSLGNIACVIGITAVTGEDELFMQLRSTLQRHRIEKTRTCIEGDVVRDWSINESMSSVWMYDDDFRILPLDSLPCTSRLWWPYRSAIYWRKRFGTPLVERGLSWYEWQELYADKLRTPLSIVYGEVATHNHFVLDRGGKVFNRTAPVIKLPPEATEDDHLALLGLLNSSTACFWMKQVSNCKGLGGQGGGIKPEDWHRAYAFNGTKLLSFPVPERWRDCLPVVRQINDVLSELNSLSPRAVVESGVEGLPLRLREASVRNADSYRKLVALQEELDWLCYDLFGLSAYTAPPDISIQYGLHPQDRPTEELLRRKMSTGEKSIFYDVHVSRGASNPGDVHPDMRAVIARRLDEIRASQDLALVETANYKRRWQVMRWEDQVKEALRNWLLARLESYFDYDGRMNDSNCAAARLGMNLISVARLADLARQDLEFQQVGEVYRGDPAFDVQGLVEELVAAECVPLLPVLRYKPTGFRKRAEWEKTWDLQRREDAGENVGNIPIPPKYESSDFTSTGGARYWALRGKLDVPKERWVSFPHCEGPDGTLVIAWAGYDHLQLARAISEYFVDIQERLGGRDDPRLVPLLACIIELLPWLKQWHHDIDPEFNQRMDEVYDAFVAEEAKNLGLTIDQIKAWQPPARSTFRGRRRTQA
ncbi:MAG: BREX-2 system adenine-specific DNA-methyltransferase PglX [Pirellulales bacterium]